MSASPLSIGQAVPLRPGSAWDNVVSSTAIGVVIGHRDNARFQVAFPTGDGRAPLVGEFSIDELLVVTRA